MGSEIINSSIIMIIIINHNWLFQCQSSSSSLAAPAERAVVGNPAKNWTLHKDWRRWWKQKSPNIGIAWRAAGGGRNRLWPNCVTWPSVASLRAEEVSDVTDITHYSGTSHCAPTSSNHTTTIKLKPCWKLKFSNIEIGIKIYAGAPGAVHAS